jgi:SHS family lactate transporter-like MFS transporter
MTCSLSTGVDRLSSAQRRAFLAAFLGWLLDGFDFTILTFVILDIQRSFTVDKALAGALGTVTLMFRLVGGAAAGTLADRYGRKLPLILSVAWFSLFSLLSGFSTSYPMLFAIRALFGIGVGGEWAAGMPLAMEHLPPRLRGTASGLLQGAWAWGFILSALVFEFVYPMFMTRPDLGWRVMFWIGALPALLVVWIRAGVAESPLWLERHRHRAESTWDDGLSLGRIFRRDLLGTTIQCSTLMVAFMFSYYAITFWYATFLRELDVSPLPHLIALNLGGIVGAAFWGHLSESRLGRRGAATLAALVGLAALPAYLFTTRSGLLFAGALLMGLGGHGVWGVAPSYLSERFPTSARGVGPGFAYHAGALVGSLTPAVIGALQDGGMSLANAMAVCIACSGAFVVLTLWFGPETRGRVFTPDD